MFDAREALRCLNGRVLNGDELRKELTHILSQHSTEIPVEFDSDDLFALACRNQWVRETTEGKLHLVIK